MGNAGNDIQKAAALLKANDVVAIPTETVYGLAGNALEEQSILKIFKVKNRPKFDPLIAHVHSLEEVFPLVKEVPKPLLDLAQRFWPGPLTLLLPKQEIVPDLLTSGSSLVAVRVPAHPLTQELLQILPFPLAAPSANPFGYVSPTTAQHVNDQLGDKIEYILDGGPTAIGLESTIVGYENGEVKVHRLGGLSIERIEAEVGPVRFSINQSSNPVAPGMLKSHYAPGKKIIVGNVDTLIPKQKAAKVGVISFQKNYDVAQNFTLSLEGSIDEAAAHLFTALRELDQSDVEVIIAEKFPEVGLGRAINDRLQRAAAPKD